MIAPADFTVAIETGGGPGSEFAVVRVSGEVDLANVDQLSAALSAAQERTAGGVVLDLAAVPFMDSSGLAVLLRAREELGDALAVVVVEGSPLARVFEIAALGDHLAIASSEAEAVAGLPTAAVDGDG